MIISVNIDNDNLINQIQKKFNDVYNHKNELKNEFINNPYINIYAYMEDNDILGFIDISDIYNRYEINNIYVLTEYRNRGIASRLLEKVIEDGKSSCKINITLEVREDNIAAIKLYEKYDFLAKATRKGYYNGIDGILMEKEMV